MNRRIIFFLWIILLGIAHASATVLHSSSNHVRPIFNTGFDAANQTSIVYDSPQKSIAAYDESSTLSAGDKEKATAGERSHFSDFAKSVAAETTESITTPIGELRAAGLKDAHHVIQDAAVRDIPGYDTQLAPGVQLEGPSTAVGSPHYAATQVQLAAGGGTYGAEREIAANALRAAGYSEAQIQQALIESDAYFESLGVTSSTPTRIPGNRH